MKGHAAIMSSGDTTGSQDWATPRPFFDLLDRAFGPFTLDAAATAKTTKCERYYSSVHNALEQNWDGVVFCNPPYGKGIVEWVEKAAWQARNNPKCQRVVMLLPARTDHTFFHETVLPQANAVLFVRGRIQFKLPGKNNSATFPSMVVIFDPLNGGRINGLPHFGYIIQPRGEQQGRIETAMWFQGLAPHAAI